jgi:peptide/nickel transport system ATP-binding protein
MALLEVDNLAVTIGSAAILKGVSLRLDEGEVLGIVGESGAGKTMTALSIMRLLPERAVASGRIALAGEDLFGLDERTMCDRRGRAIGMVFQEPMSALNPVKTIGRQVAETVLIHRRVSRREANELARQTLDHVGLPAARFPLDRYPHELSGGERQRVVIAMAVALKPKLLIADEPTSALDVTTQARILDLLRRLMAEDGVSLLLISHDLAMMAAMADRLAIMKDGEVVEAGTADLFANLRHPYSKMLFAAASYRSRRKRREPAEGRRVPILEVRNIVREYRLPGRSPFQRAAHLSAVDNVGFTIHRGENVGLVGESGSGKSTLARVVLALDRPRRGDVILDGADFLAARGRRLRDLRRHIQAVFQDPYGSFDPRHKVASLIAEPFHLAVARPSAAERRRRVDEALTAVGLTPADGDKYPHEFSGGQRQRLAIARALITEPSLIVLDEAVSALDASIRAQILDLLADLNDRLGVSYLFISHDLAVVRAITDRVVVMQDGRIVEEGETERVFTNPRHPYTASLIAAAPDLERTLAARRAPTPVGSRTS